MTTTPSPHDEIRTTRPIATSLFIHGIGTAVPTDFLTQEQVAEHMQITSNNSRTLRLIRRLGRQTGIAKRHLVALAWQNGAGCVPLYRPVDEQPMGPGMSERNEKFESAAETLIREGADSLDPDRLAAAQTLITVTCTHAASPGIERPVFNVTPVDTRAQRWNLGFMGCSAGLAALRLAHGLQPEQQDALIVSCELSSLHFQYSDAVDQIKANMLFADGAAMMLTSADPSPVKVIHCRCVNLPEAADQMTWFAGDHGLRLTLARELPGTIGHRVAHIVDDTLAACGRNRQEVVHWLVHPGGPQILDSVEAALELEPCCLVDSRTVLHEFGNMSSSTIFFILQRAIQRGESGLCVALAFGPGLTVEIAVIEIGRPFD
jgi:predicted naringenin-chalcone synthase